MERKDLIEKNVSIMKAHGSALERCADRNCKVVVVANPANTNCLIAMKYAPSIPRENFTALTRLDHDRMRGMIACRISETIKRHVSPLNMLMRVWIAIAAFYPVPCPPLRPFNYLSNESNSLLVPPHPPLLACRSHPLASRTSSYGEITVAHRSPMPATQWPSLMGKISSQQSY